VLYLGEINDSQKTAWCRSIAVLRDDEDQTEQLAIFPEDLEAPVLDCDVVQVRLSGLQLKRPRQWGGCWLSLELWDQLQLDAFWEPKLRPSRKGTRWLNVLKTLVCNRLIEPGSEWRLHRHWYEASAMGDLLGEDFGVAESHKLYRCLDKLLAHKAWLFSFLQTRWRELFDARFDVLLYDLHRQRPTVRRGLRPLARARPLCKPSARRGSWTVSDRYGLRRPGSVLSESNSSRP
jgi:hypothetical protein